jgi:ABC-type transporter Mla subunit MlaD
MRTAGPIRSLAASPALVGSITVLMTVLVVFLAYNANSGLPFVPTYRVSVQVPDASRLGPNSEVRIGGVRVGVVESIEAVQPDAGRSAAEGSGSEEVSPAAARLDLRLDRSVEPLARDSIFRVRYRSTFGFKYLEVVRGTGPPAPAGFTFVGTDDRGVCKLPENLERFSSEIPEPARNGCFQPQTEFDEVGNLFDARTRTNARDALTGFGDALAGRGGSLNSAIEELRPLLADLAPVARTLSARGTRLERFVLALDRTAAAIAPVSEQAAELFTNAAIAFEALSRDPDALGDAISGAVPLLEAGVATLPEQRALLADVAELFRRLGPGARQLPIAVPVLTDAIEAGAPVLRRTPPAARDLRAVLRELRRAVEQPSTRIVLQRLRDTLDHALSLAAHVVPAQTVCNYWNYWFTFVPEHLSERSNIGFTQRNVFVQVPPGPGQPVSIGGAEFDFPSTARAPLGGYSGEASDGLAGPLPDPAEEGLFKPRDLPIGHAPINAPHGQLTGEFPDCASGQFGYPLGRLPLPGQRPSDPQIGVGDYPGSLGPTTLFFNADGARELRDTRVGSRSPDTWGIGG